MNNNISNIKLVQKEYSVINLVDSNNKDFVTAMVKLFIDISREFINEINLAIIDNNLSQINQSAHRIKASIDVMVIASLSKVVREIENSNVINDELKDKINFITEKLEFVTKQMENDFA
jgi:HPt (histidine-containing phosphotransfer) domain-containing protein